VRGSGAVPFQASPDFVQEGRLLITLWAFVPDAVADLGVAEQNAGELIAERITDFTPAAETWEKVTINGISFIIMDGTGKEKAQNGALVNVSAAFFNPEGTHVFLLMVTGFPEILEKYEGEVHKIMNSISPGTLDLEGRMSP
jgi:co-chaperonin GroES (HSP10)